MILIWLITMIWAASVVVKGPKMLECDCQSPDYRMNEHSEINTTSYERQNERPLDLPMGAVGFRSQLRNNIL